MNKVFIGLAAFVLGVAVLSNNVSAGALDNVKVLQGKVHVEKSSSGEVKSITVKPADGDEVRVTVDEISKEMVRIDGHGVFATGSYTSGGSFKVATWFMRDKQP
jgi:hypothetical protein